MAHYSQFALFSIRLPFSPDSHYFIATKGYPSRFAIIDAGTFDVVRLEEIHAPEFAWSPDSRRLVFLEYTGRLPDSDGVACVLDCDTGDIHRFRLGGSMRPVAWLDPTTVVWLNHWAGTDMAGEGPLSIARVDVSSGVVQEIPVH